MKKSMNSLNLFCKYLQNRLSASLRKTNMPDYPNKLRGTFKNTIIQAVYILHPTNWTRNFPLSVRIYTRNCLTETQQRQCFVLYL
jgi:hypothetical protein